MALKTFNLDDKAYKAFAEHCKKEGISMSRKIDNFIRAELENLKVLSIKKEHKDKEAQKEKTIETNAHTVSAEQHSFSKYC
jgi:hypothetical protein